MHAPCLCLAGLQNSVLNLARYLRQGGARHAGGQPEGEREREGGAGQRAGAGQAHSAWGAWDAGAGGVPWANMCSCTHGMPAPSIAAACVPTIWSAMQGTPQGDAAKKRLPEVMDSLRCGQKEHVCCGWPRCLAGCCRLRLGACFLHAPDTALPCSSHIAAGRRSRRWPPSAPPLRPPAPTWSAWPPRRRSWSSAWRRRCGFGRPGGSSTAGLARSRLCSRQLGRCINACVLHRHMPFPLPIDSAFCLAGCPADVARAG